MNYSFLRMLLPLLLIIASEAWAGAPSPIDGFNPSLNAKVYAIIIQPDGKILIGGDINIVEGVSRNGVARLNNDGSVDKTFDPGAGTDLTVKGIAVQRDGKVIIVGNFTKVNGVARGKVARLNPNGSLDTSFVPPSFQNLITAAVQTDGKIVVAGTGTIARLNASGAVDTTFNPSIHYESRVNSMAIQSDGKILVGGNFLVVNGIGRNRIARLDSNGTIDWSFNPGNGANDMINHLAIQPDGRVVIVGDFTSYNGRGCNRIARLNVDGTYDVAFDAGAGLNLSPISLAIQADGRILVGTNMEVMTRFDANGSRDATFNVTTRTFEPVIRGTILALAVQNDGMILIGGNFKTVQGVARTHLARLYADGSVEQTLSGGCGANGEVRAVVRQHDGKVIIGGNFTMVNGMARNRIARLCANGAIDMGFNPGSGANATVNALGLQSDGKVLVGGDFSSFSGVSRRGIARLNVDGGFDSTFKGFTGTGGTGSSVYAIAVQPDDKILLGGGFQYVNGQIRNWFARLNPDGSLDSCAPQMSHYVFAIALQADGKILVGGWFGGVNSIPRDKLARLNPDCSLDASYYPVDETDMVRALAVQPDGKLLVGGRRYQSCYLKRLNEDGSRDTTFSASPNDSVESIVVTSGGKLLVGGAFTRMNGTLCSHLAWLNPDGSLDSARNGPGANNSIYAMAPQPNGGIFAGGLFTTIGGTEQNRIGLVNSDGSIDTSFGRESTGANGYVDEVALQVDGKILMGGGFSAFNGLVRSGIARLDQNGNLDTSFEPESGVIGLGAIAPRTDGKMVVSVAISDPSRYEIRHLNGDGDRDTSWTAYADAPIGAVAVQPDGKLLITGLFKHVDATTRTCIARLNPDASLDITFDAGELASADTNDPHLRAIALQPDGRIIVGGYFKSINGITRKNIARLNANGSVDAWFNPGQGPGSGIYTGQVYALAIEPDGKVIVTGVFESFNGVTRYGVARLNSDGSVDAGFNPPTSRGDIYYSIALQADGKILLAGSCRLGNTSAYSRLVRLNMDGSLDCYFETHDHPPVNMPTITGEIGGVVLQPDGKALVCGDFDAITSTTRNRIARISNPDAARQKLSVAGGGWTVTWELGGSSPWPYQVLFEDSTDGVVWHRLGFGAPVQGVGYQISGVSIPTGMNHYVRATGWLSGGSSNGSISLYQSVARVYTDAVRNAVGGWLIYE